MQNRTRAVRVPVAAAKPAVDVDPGEELLYDGVNKKGQEIDLGSARSVTFTNSSLENAKLLIPENRRPNIQIIGCEAAGLSLASSSGSRQFGSFAIERSDITGADFSAADGELRISHTTVDRLNIEGMRGYLTMTAVTGSNVNASRSEMEAEIKHSDVPGMNFAEAKLTNLHLCSKTKAPQANFQNATFDGGCFTAAGLEESDFRGGSGINTAWIETTAPRLRAQGLKLLKAQIQDSDLTGIETDEHSSFLGAELVRTKLAGTNGAHFAGASITSDKGMPFMRVSKRMLNSPALVKTLKDARGESLEDLRQRAQKRGIEVADLGLGE